MYQEHKSQQDQSQQDQEISLQELKDVVNFFDLATHFEEKKLKVTYNSVNMVCPFHNEKTPSFFYSIEKKFYYCHGCKESGDIFDYVIKRKSCSFKDAVRFLLEFFNIDKGVARAKTTQVGSFKKQMEAINKYKQKDLKEFSHFTEEDIKKMVEFRKGIKLTTPFTEETLDFFEAGLDIAERRIALPIRDEYNHLLGSTGRTLDKNYVELGIPKWRHYKNSNTSSTFFNIKNAIEESRLQNNSIIIVEGPKDVMWLHQCGFKNTIACLTNTVSQVQKGILLRNFITVYLFLDGDAGGANGQSDIHAKIKGYFNTYVVDTPKGKDPDKMSKEEIASAIKAARKIN